MAPPWRRWASPDWPIFRNGWAHWRCKTCGFAPGGHEANLALPGRRIALASALDAALVHAAIESGAAVPAEHRRDPGTDQRASSARSGFAAPDKESRSRARIAVAADGLSGSFLKETPGMEPIVAPGAPLGVGAVVDGSNDYYEPGTIYMACAP